MASNRSSEKAVSSRFDMGKNLFRRAEGESLLDIDGTRMRTLADEEMHANRLIYNAGINLQEKFDEEEIALNYRSRNEGDKKYAPPICFVFAAKGSETRRTHHTSSGHTKDEKKRIKNLKKEHADKKLKFQPHDTLADQTNFKYSIEEYERIGDCLPIKLLEFHTLDPFPDLSTFARLNPFQLLR